jgi:hypothetical protein
MFAKQSFATAKIENFCMPQNQRLRKMPCTFIYPKNHGFLRIFEGFFSTSIYLFLGGKSSNENIQSTYVHLKKIKFLFSF